MQTMTFEKLLQALLLAVIMIAVGTPNAEADTRSRTGDLDMVDKDHDGLSDRWELFWFQSLTAAEPYADSDGDGIINLDEFQTNGNPVKSSRTPTCSFGPEDFHGGLDGYCTETSPGTYDLRFEDWNGIELLAYSWPGSLVAPPATDCLEQCDAGALWVAYNTQRFNLNPSNGLPTSPLSGFDAAVAAAPVGCPLNPNAGESYKQCADGKEFRCFLACGKGCVGCEVTTAGDCSTDTKTCKKHDFKCYKRPCCVAHDQCLDKAKNLWQEIKCHRQAQKDGCSMKDARGETHGLPDATCFNPAQQCLEVPAPKPPKEACCTDGNCECGCQEASPEECFESGGTAAGPETTCEGVIIAEPDDPMPIDFIGKLQATCIPR